MNQSSIKNIIYSKGYTLAQMAAMLNVSAGYLSMVLSGKRKLNLDRFFRLCEILNQNPGMLYKELNSQV